MVNDSWIEQQDLIPWESDRVGQVDVSGVLVGQGPNALEIVLSEASSRPTKNQLQRLWNERRSGRANPILVVTVYNGTADICGPSGEDPPVKRDIEPDIVKRLCELSLHKSNRHAANRFLSERIHRFDGDLIGIRNQGLLSTHELKEGVPSRGDWEESSQRSEALLDLRERELLKELGYSIEPLSGNTYLLKHDERESAVAIFLEEDESFSLEQERFNNQSPVKYAINQAERKRVDFVIGNSGGVLRLYSTKPDAGFGSRGRTDTFVEADLSLMGEDELGYLWLLFSASAIEKDGSLHDIIEASRDYATALGKRLRERIYDDALPELAKAIAEARELGVSPTKEQLDETYQMSLLLLFRLLFIAYGEDEGLLPYKMNPRYTANSLKEKAHELNDVIQEGGRFDSTSSTHWDDVLQLSTAIHDGHSEWDLPTYNGALLSTEDDVSPLGAKLVDLTLTNDQFAPALASILIDESEDGIEGPVDFRNVGVREFGIIYEGLLESELSVAEKPLTIQTKDDKEIYVPLEDEEQDVDVPAGSVYLHGTSGERKATGTFYTKKLFVEHLLEHSLEPALQEHFERLEEMTDREAEEHFFDFKVADIAMGSGHFLVSVVDRMEKAFSKYLLHRSLPGVEGELRNLKDKALSYFQSDDAAPEIEQDQLLRRLIARRCIYGVDLNPLAVQLARLSIWVHTFVPGLPLTFLNHNLIDGDSLSGVGTVREVTDLIEEDGGEPDLFVETQMQEAKKQIQKLGQLSDKDAREIREAREAQKALNQKSRQQEALFDIVSGSRVDDEIHPARIIHRLGEIEDLTETEEYKQAQEALESTNPVHFPIAFPEVFHRERGGFDVVVGNPPWEEATLEEDEFWMRYEPGLFGKSSQQQEEIQQQLREERPDLVEKYEQELKLQEKRRNFLVNGPYEGMGTGDPDLYKGFSWRFFELLNKDGYSGVVLPRSAFVAAGSEDFRRSLLEEVTFEELTFLVNNKQWIFEIHPQYTVTLMNYQNKVPDASTTLPLRAPYHSKEAYLEGMTEPPVEFDLEVAKNWTKKASFPLLPSKRKAVEVFKKMAEVPSLDSQIGEWRARPNTELHATNDTTADDGTTIIHKTESPPEDHFWPVYKGASFDLCNPDTDTYYGWADPDVAVEYLQESRENSYQYAGSRSAFYEMDEDWIHDPETLPCFFPRIAFRDITNRTNRRTTIACLLPPEICIVNNAPYFLWPLGDERDQAYLLGILSTMPFDWYSRRFVEEHLNYHILNALPVPRPGRSDSIRQQVVQLSGRLAAVDERYAEWADQVGVDYGEIDPDTKQELIEQLDALVAKLYGLTADDIRLVFETFHQEGDYYQTLQRRKERVLDHFHAL